MILAFWNWLDRYLFGEFSERKAPGALALRLLRYPYALLRDLSRGQINLHAMGLVYATLLSLLPLIAFAFAILTWFGAQSELRPIVLEFFRPMGEVTAGEITQKVMTFAEEINPSVLGALGLALLLWTLLGTIKKVEDSFNFLWRVEEPRSFARRVTEYITLLIVGPIVLVSFLGLTHNAIASASSFGDYIPFFDRLDAFRKAISPYIMVAAIFTAVYMFVPNTKVKWKPAAIGGVVGGILWAAVGQLFTALVLASTRLTVVYAGFAIIVATLLWTYFGWLILLVGAQLSFYVQNPNYLRMGLTELRMSAVQREQLTLKIMFLVGRAYHDGKTRWTVDALAHHLGMPGIAISRLVHALEDAHLITLTDDECMLPARDLGQISIQEIIDIARNEKAGQVGWRKLTIPAVDAISKTMDDAWRKGCGEMTLRDLIEEPA